MRTIDQVESLQRTNPELVIWPFSLDSDNGTGMNVQLKPFDDIRVRKAMQMALNLEEINNAYYKGNAQMIPQGQINRSFAASVTQFEEWPEDVKKVFDYDPEGAEALLDEAGYPRGANGIRFKTEYLAYEVYDLNYVELLVSYWNKIGIDVEIDGPHPGAVVAPRRSERDFEMIFAEGANRWYPLALGARFTPAVGHNSSNVNDPVYTAKYEAGLAATTIEEQNRIAGELDQYAIEKFWTIWGGMAPQYNAFQPWVIGYNGEGNLGVGQVNTVFTRVWIDQDLKEAMGR
jgi:peptide/nickel transport system substrate-binding protein